MAKCIMIQGTASNAGKSLIATALCRIFRQEGYAVAPFKSQNMALNSYITADGLEMGRAQVAQAEAAGIEPTVLMNPILLKPHSDSGSQVIVNGEVWGTMSAVEYYRRKQQLRPVIRRAYEELASQYDLVVIEGAGSPAEINLKENDLVNMGMARMAQAPVLLVGDIDRGGVFAALAGTLLLLEPEERAMVQGTLINKFRGDVEILRPGLAMLEEITHKPVLGVVPYAHIELDEEDSLSERLGRTEAKKGLPDIAVIRLPRLSNATDFHVLERLPQVSLRYVSTSKQFGTPDMVLLPGTKNTMEDLLWLRQTGLEAQIQKYAARGGLLFGICGGYQMLGQTLSDPFGIERGGKLAGLGLLPVHTVFSREKTRTRVQGRIKTATGMLCELSGIPCQGYEIHMGQSVYQKGKDSRPFLELEDGRLDGACSGNVYGTYLHGFFDQEAVIGGLVQVLCRAKGNEYREEGPSPADYKEQQYNKLAQLVRNSVDMNAIYTILERGI